MITCFTMDNFKLGTLGNHFKSMIDTQNNAALLEIKNDVKDFVATWKADFKAFENAQKEDVKSKRRKLNEESQMEMSYVSATSRPTRSARNVAISNIKKQSQLPLNRKMRRPDSKEMSESGSFIYIGDERTTFVGGSHKSEPETAETEPEVVEFIKPKMRAKKGRKKEAGDVTINETISVEVERKMSLRVEDKENEALEEKQRSSRSREASKRKTEETPANKTVSFVEDEKEDSEGNEAEEKQRVSDVSMPLEDQRNERSIEDNVAPENLQVEGNEAQKKSSLIVRQTRSRSRSGITILAENLEPSPILAPEGTKNLNVSVQESSVVVFEDPDSTTTHIVDTSVMNRTVTRARTKKRKQAKNDETYVRASKKKKNDETFVSKKKNDETFVPKKKKRMSDFNISEVSEVPLRRSSHYLEFQPVSESSLLVAESGGSRNCTVVLSPLVVSANGTFVKGKPRTPAVEAFANETLATVIRKPAKEESLQATFIRESPEKEEVDLLDTEEEEAEAEVEFQAPLPVAPKRTKPVKNPKMYNAEGELITSQPQASKRTKVLTAATVQNIPDISMDRPVRTRTKVRRFGMEDESQAEVTVSINPPPSESSRQSQPKEKRNTGKAVVRLSKGSKICKSVNKVLLSKLKTPASHLKHLTNSNSSSGLKIRRPPLITASTEKENALTLKNNGVTKIVSKLPEREDRLLAKQKEELALQKKAEELNRKKELQKQRNEKLMAVKNNRVKMEVEKQEMVLQAEREREEKRKQLLIERELKKKEEVAKKKMMAEKKAADIEERRRLENEARMAKLEQEQQKQLQEKQRLQELEEKRARERAEEQRKMKEADKLLKNKLAAANRPPMYKPNVSYSGMYHPMNENDLGLEDEVSEESGDEERPPTEKPIPAWVSAGKKNPVMKYLTLYDIKTFMPMPPGSPDVHRMFNMSPRRVLRRTSSAIWNQSTFTP